MTDECFDGLFSWFVAIRKSNPNSPAVKRDDIKGDSQEMAEMIQPSCEKRGAAFQKLVKM